MSLLESELATTDEDLALLVRHYESKVHSYDGGNLGPPLSSLIVHRDALSAELARREKEGTA